MHRITFKTEKILRELVKILKRIPSSLISMSIRSSPMGFLRKLEYNHPKKIGVKRETFYWL